MLCLLFAALPPLPTLVFLLSAAAHECGHAAVMRLLGIGHLRFRLRGGGAVLHGDISSSPYLHELLAAAAGPAVNVLLALLFSGNGTVCSVNVLLAAYNLLPLPGNDGAVMLCAVCRMTGHDGACDRMLGAVGQVLWAVLWMGSAWVFWFGALADAGGGAVGYGALFFCVLVRGLTKREVL